MAPASSNPMPDELIGETVAVTPRIQRMLKIFDPTTLPIAMSDCFRKAATTLVASSGRLVPAATTVRPITASDTPQDFAKAVAPSTNSCEPRIKTPSPTKRTAVSMSQLFDSKGGTSISAPSVLPDTFFPERTAATT